MSSTGAASRRTRSGRELRPSAAGVSSPASTTLADGLAKTGEYSLRDRVLKADAAMRIRGRRELFARRLTHDRHDEGSDRAIDALDIAGCVRAAKPPTSSMLPSHVRW